MDAAEPEPYIVDPARIRRCAADWANASSGTPFASTVIINLDFCGT
jgi:hypothetical protein